MKTLYLAGPMRGIKHSNFPAFRVAKDALLRAGYAVLSPADMDNLEGFNEYFCVADAEFLEMAWARDFDTIERSDGVALMPGWERSEGALVEEQHAHTMGIPAKAVEVWLEAAK